MAKIIRSINGTEHTFELSWEEKHEIYLEMKHEFMREDIAWVLENEGISEIDDEDMRDLLSYYEDHAEEGQWEDVIKWGIDHLELRSDEEA